MLLLFFVFQRTTLGLRMRAAAFNPEIARILGIRVGRMLTLGWGLAALLGALAGMLAAPSVYLYPSNMDEVLVFGFTGAIIGGLESPVGAVAGAVGVGLALSYVSGYIGSDLAPLGGFVILIVVLMLRPQGLFTLRQAAAGMSRSLRSLHAGAPWALLSGARRSCCCCSHRSSSTPTPTTT